ncbi:MAG: radical SAM protein [Candidatus Bathyarchaeota archaeon]|nr:radical SAM protein [Candidatus Bathyarchaeota archaeon]
MIIREVAAKTILSKSKVLDYSVNPYLGCEHGCTYCYARFMKRFSGHKEAWGQFIDVKINAATLLRKDIRKKKVGRVWISGTCDPYQPIEKRYQLTRACLEVLAKHRWPVTVQTKSPLVTRDLDLLGALEDVEVGLTITTADDAVRKTFEPHCPPIDARISAVDRLHSSGLKTFVMIAPLLPKAERLVSLIRGKTDHVLVDKMNYHYADWVYKESRLGYAKSDRFFHQKKRELEEALNQEGIPSKFLF